MPACFKVTPFARYLDNPRWIHVLGNGDILVSEAKTRPKGQSNELPDDVSADRITLFRDADGDGVPELRQVFLADFNPPFGMLPRGDRFYVANTDGVHG